MTPVLDIQKSVLVNDEVSETANEGDTLSYTITVANNGDEPSYNLFVEDTTPTNTTLVNPSGDLATATFSGDTFKWGPFDLLGGETRSFTFDVTVNSGLPVGVNEITNQATLWKMEIPKVAAVEQNFFQKALGVKVANAQVEPTLVLVATSNLVLTTVTIAEEPETPVVPETPGKVLGDETEAKLEVTKTASVEFTNPGETITYTVVVKNTGDAQALGVTVKDTLPDGFTFADSGDKSKTWFIGAVDMDGSKTLSYEVKVAANAVVGDYINTVLVSADNTDSVETTATVEVRVPKVLGDSVPETGTTPRDYAIFISSLMLIAAGIFLIRRGQSENIA